MYEFHGIIFEKDKGGQKVRLYFHHVGVRGALAQCFQMDTLTVGEC